MASGTGDVTKLRSGPFLVGLQVSIKSVLIGGGVGENVLEQNIL